MKRWHMLVSALLVCAAAGSARGEWVFEDFEAMPPGSIASQPGWETSDATARVAVGVGAYSNQALELPEVPGQDVLVQAVYTNFFVAWTAADHPVIRVAFDYEAETTNGSGIMALGYPGHFKLFFGAQGGHVFFNGVDTGAKHVVTNYAPVVMYYDMTDNRAALDYNHTNVAAWADAGGTVLSNFDRLWFQSDQAAARVDGAVRVDNLVVETFPADTLAWWRFDEGHGDYLDEQTGRFPPAWSIGYARTWVNGLADPLYAGRDVHNPSALQHPLTVAVTSRHDTAVFSNWTMEAVVRILPGGDNVAFCEWVTGAGFNSTNTELAMDWIANASNVVAYLRDGEATSMADQYVSQAGFLPADGMWHHVALVKTGAELVGYLDYEPVRTSTLSSVADGNYRMETGNHCRLGIALNGGNSADPEDIFDEIRITGRALSAGEFLQAGRPVFVRAPERGASTWTTRFFTVAGTTNYLEAAPHPDGPWSPVGVVTAKTGMVEAPLPAPDPSEAINVMHVRR